MSVFRQKTAPGSAGARFWGCSGGVGKPGHFEVKIPEIPTLPDVEHLANLPFWLVSLCPYLIISLRSRSGPATRTTRRGWDGGLYLVSEGPSEAHMAGFARPEISCRRKTGPEGLSEGFVFDHVDGCVGEPAERFFPCVESCLHERRRDPNGPRRSPVSGQEGRISPSDGLPRRRDSSRDRGRGVAKRLRAGSCDQVLRTTFWLAGW